MKRKSSKYYSMVYCLLAAAVFLCGCGQDNSSMGSQKGNEIKQEETIYVSQSLSLPEYASFDGAYSDGKDLYYAAAQFDQASGQYNTAFYTLKEGTTEPEMIFGLPANQRVLKMTMDEEGNIYYLGYEEVSEDENPALSGTMLYKLDQTGTTLLTLDLAEYTKGQEQAMIQGLAVDGENRMVLITSNQKVFVLDPSGQLLFETRADGVIFDICESGGKVFVAYGGIGGAEVREVDIPGKKLSPKLEHNISANRLYIAADGSGNLLMATEESVYQYHLERAETVKKFDWQTYDVTGITAGILLPYGEKGVLTINRDYGSYPMKVEATIFREAAEGEAAVPEKTVLILGTATRPSTVIKEEIIAFNKANPDFKIEIKYYYEEDGIQAYEEASTKLYMEIMAGTAPDLLLMPNYRIGQLAKGGAVEDLKPYFDEDETLDPDDFLGNILRAYEIQGRLYGMPVNFRIDTIAGRTSVVGEESGWNLDELIAFAERFPQGTDVFDDASKSGVLHLLKRAYTDQLVDTDNAGSPLDRELLTKMLTFANRYQDDDRYIYDSNLQGRVMEGQMFLLAHYVSDGSYYRAYANSVFDESVTFKGYPTEGGNGHLIYSDHTFAINSRCEYKDTAWAFISGLLSKETQIKIGEDYATTLWSFPVRKDALEEHFAFFMKYPGSDFIGTRGGIFIRQVNKEVTEEEIAPIRDLIQSADTILTVSPDIDQIIEEEASLYFSGIKPVEEVVDVIENRIRTYVNETK